MSNRILIMDRSLVSAAACSCRLRRMVMTAQSPLTAARRVSLPTDERWELVFNTTLLDRDKWAELEALLHDLDGVSGFVRIHDPSNILPRGVGAGIHASYAATGSVWSDGTLFTDGRGWADGSATGAVKQTANRGSDEVVLKGLVASTAEVLKPGDRFELRGLMYMVVARAASNASGEALVRIRPRLRHTVLANDPVNFYYPSTVYKLLNDDSGVFERISPNNATATLNFIEAPEVLLEGT